MAVLRTGMRTVRALIAFVLAISLSLIMPAYALADVEGEDTVGTQSIDQRGLSVAYAPDINSACGILISSDGTVLWSRYPDNEQAMASTTKMMTCIIAIESTSNLDEPVTISEDAVTTAEDESSSGLVAGETTTLRSLLYGMMLSSGNDSAVAVADAVAGDETSFVALMNQKASDLGLTETHFVTCNGLEADGHYSSPRDLATLAQYCMKNETFRGIVNNYSVDVDLGHGTQTITNTDTLFTWYPYLIGIKTGYEDQAGYCMVGAALQNNLELYCVVLGADSTGARFDDVHELFTWGYQHYVKTTLSDTTTIVANVPHSEWRDVTVPVTCKDAVDAYVLDFDGAVTQDISVLDLSGDVHQGDVVGTITWSQNNKVVGTSELVAAQDVDGPSFFQRVGIWYNRTFKGGQKTAQLQVLKQPVTIQAPQPTES